uniref:Uncharacterized protein n=1 Tax=Vespula pensylvanica TaxID=30213 RepID=A0A834UF23_VESPE|nr:hypothetical protein H0235_003242 [Vespula pensylvanica]
MDGGGNDKLPVVADRVVEASNGRRMYGPNVATPHGNHSLSGEPPALSRPEFLVSHSKLSSSYMYSVQGITFLNKYEEISTCVISNGSSDGKRKNALSSVF